MAQLSAVPLARKSLALLLVVFLAGLLPIAYADPPDPSWISGFWDDDDFDTVVVFIANTSAIPAESGFDAGPLGVAIAPVASAGRNCVRTPLRRTPHPRAPPVDPLPHC